MKTTRKTKSEDHSRNIFEAVKAKASIDDVYRKLTPADHELNGPGPKHSIRCPVPGHEDRNPSAMLWTNVGGWRCYGCGAGGTVIDLVMEARNIHKPIEAARWLADQYNLDVEVSGESSSGTKIRSTLIEQFVAYANTNLREEHFDHLRSRLGDGEYIQDAGYEPREEPEDRERAARIGLISKNGNYMARNRYVLPVRRFGRPAYFVLYGPDAAPTMKYWFPRDLEKPLWGVDRIDPDRPVFLVEGPFDHLSLRAAGLQSVCSLGTSVKADHVRQLSAYSNLDLRILFDTGEEENALRTAKDLWPEVRATILSIPGPEGTDPNDLWGEDDFDQNRFRSRLRDLKGKTAYERLIEKQQKDNGQKDLPYNDEILDLIAPLPPMERDRMVTRYAEATGCTKGSIRDQLPAGKKCNEKNTGVDPETNDHKNLTTRIAEEVAGEAEIFHDQRKDAYARVPREINGDTYHEILKVGSSQFFYYLVETGHRLNDFEVPNTDALNMARKAIEARAFRSGEEKELHNRVARHAGDLWIDMSDDRHRAIRVTSGDWKIVDDPPILFRREKHMRPQVEPAANGDPWSLFEFANIPEDKQLLTLCYVISCFVPDIIHPVPIFHGEPGAGKTVAMRFIRQIVDPTRTPLLQRPGQVKDLIQQFDHHWMAYYENMRKIPDWLSDMFCRAVTGAGSEVRQLFTDDGAFIRRYRRCIGMNGVNIAVNQSDLLDRSFLVEIKPPEEYEGITTLGKKFEKARPEILGGLLDTLAEAKTRYEKGVDIPVQNRRLEFMKWGYSIAEVLGSGGETFLEQYLEDEEKRIDEAIGSNPVGRAINTYMKEKTEVSHKTSDLLAELEKVAEKHNISTDQKLWPANAAWLTRRLKPLIPVLRKKGITIEFRRDGAGNNIYLSKKRQEPSN